MSHALSLCFRRSLQSFFFVFFNDTSTTEIYTLSLHDALPIYVFVELAVVQEAGERIAPGERLLDLVEPRSEEHTSELQSRQYLVCRLLLEKKKKASRTRPDSNMSLLHRISLIRQMS